MNFRVSITTFIVWIEQTNESCDDINLILDDKDKIIFEGGWIFVGNFSKFTNHF